MFTLSKAKRLELHEILCDILGSRNVYFQPPPSIKMRYPAIVYSLNNINNKYADNGVYIARKSYAVTVIDKDPDSEIPDKVNRLPSSNFDRHYVTDNLYHDTFTIFY